MRRFLKILGGLLLVLVLFVAIVAVMGPKPGEAGGLTLNGASYARREGDHAAFLVTFANTTNAGIENPQLQVVVDLGGQTYSCPGWFDTVTDEAITGTDPITRPLVIPAQSETPAHILCRIPDVSMDGAVVRLR